MQNEHQKPLIVYKASAGSGKTFTLATEYIKLVVCNPLAYRHILAVTFTNKATEEMKMRILSQLYGIAQSLPASDRYAQKVAEELGMPTEYVRQQAGIALRNLLHNYSYFRVETIDSFFQSVLRNLARELDLTANMRVSLNDSQIEELAVDQLIEELSVHDKLLQWLLKYIMENISDDKSWNVIGQIKHFGKTIFNEFYKNESEAINHISREKDFFENYTALLKTTRTKARQRMQEIAESFFAELEAEGLTPSDINYGYSGIPGFFKKLKEGSFDESIVGKRIEEGLVNPASWSKKTHPQREHIIHLAETTLGDILRYAVEERPTQWKLFKSADLTLRHLNQLRLLSSIEQKVRSLNEDANRFLLSDTQQLLHDLIDGSDSPFIFEKIGSQLEHIMIDEFQDTSTVQWKNFRILLQETMSHDGTENLIVGDVKQSIYRWRNGDWRLLAGISTQFPNADKLIDIRPLNTNWRSMRNIINFNNAFFETAAAAEEVDAYDDVVQKVPSEKGSEGEVNIVLLPSEDYRDNTLHRLSDHICGLLESGVSPTDIAILVRFNRDMPLIANYFMAHCPDVSIVSDEAFRLDSSPAVTTIINAMRFLVNPDDHIAKAYLAMTFSGEVDGSLPSDFTPALLQEPIYDMAEHLFQLFRLNEMAGQSAYLCTFFDAVATFVSEQTADLEGLLEEWDTNLCSKAIQSAEVSGVRIISIHKSKGLEFNYVVIPFCDWPLSHKDIIWCKPQEAPFNQVPLVPIDFSKSGMAGTIYEQDYEKEHQQTTIDNLNLLYVAFTRASESLLVIGKRGAGGSRSMLIEQILPEVADRLSGAIVEGVDDKSLPLSFSYGMRQTKVEQHEGSNTTEPQPNPFLATPQPVEISIETYTQKVEFKQSNKSRDFARADDDEEDRQESYVKLGSVLHQVFSTIKSTQDIDKALKELELEGIIYNEDVTRQKIESLIRKRLTDPRVAEWFSNTPDEQGATWQLFNECNILCVDPATNEVIERRPDRVMMRSGRTVVVDFKFGRERKEYHDQVEEYMNLLRQMGHPHVEGYLWFVYSNKIIEVK